MSQNLIQIHTLPESSLLRKACASVLLDEHYPTAWGDSTPRNFQAWMNKFETKTWLPFVWTFGDDIAGLQWAHDFGSSSDGGYVWMGGSVIRPFRGRRYFDLRMEAWGMVRSLLEQEGYLALLGASIVGNHAAYAFITACGYTAVGTYKDWLVHRGRLIDVILYAIRPQDQNLLWLLAEKRAHNTRVFYHQITEERAEESPYCHRYIDHRQL